GIIALVLMFLFGKNLAAIFGGSQEIIELARAVMYIVFLGFPFIGVLYTDMTLLQVTGHEVSSVMLILSRQVVFLIPLVFIIPAIASIVNIGVSPIMSLFICMPLADLLAVLFASTVKKIVAKKSPTQAVEQSSKLQSDAE
ncbi:MAG: MATE family efflux transporter, partial [Clostridia bacterium]